MWGLTVGPLSHTGSSNQTSLWIKGCEFYTIEASHLQDSFSRLVRFRSEERRDSCAWCHKNEVVSGWLRSSPQTICGIPIQNLYSQGPHDGSDWVSDQIISQRPRQIWTGQKTRSWWEIMEGVEWNLRKMLSSNELILTLILHKINLWEKVI